MGSGVQMVTIAVGSAQHAEDARVLSHGPRGPLCYYPHITHEGTQARSRAPTRRAGMHILTLDHPCRAPSGVPALSPRSLSSWPRPSAGRAAPGSGTSQGDEPRALGTIKRPLSFSSCLTAPSCARAGFPSELNNKRKHSSAPSGHAGSWRKGGCSFPEQRGRICL